MKFIGDTHGKTGELVIKLASIDEPVLQIGDMGLGFRGVFLPQLPEHHKFIRGNHDAPEACRAHPNYAGDYGTWGELFFLGGAFSIDRAWRVEGVSWWADEQLSDEQLAAAIALYERVKPRIVASHEAPQTIGERLLLDNGFRPEKWGSTQARTARALQVMFQIHQPEQWFFGHYHRDWTTTQEGTKFTCLNELTVSESVKLALTGGAL